MKKIKLDIQRFSIPYTYLEFEDLPSTNTPINATNLNAMQDSIHEETQEDIKNAVTGDLVVDSIRTKNMFDKNSILMGYELNSADGTTSANSNYYVSDYIPVKPNTNYYLTKTNNSTSNCFYDINKNFISTIRKDQGVITTPDNSNVYYMRFNGPLSDLDNVQVEEGSVATEYKPYQNLDKTLDIYSTSEIRIGTWIDGKPIYRKTILRTNAITANTENVIDMNISNIDIITNISGVLSSSNKQVYRQINTYNLPNTNSSISMFAQINGIVKIYANENWGSPNIIITLEYTKTID